MTKINNDTFDQWMYRIDDELDNRWGFSSLDMPDLPWYDWYDADYTIRQAITEAMEMWEADF